MCIPFYIAIFWHFFYLISLYVHFVTSTLQNAFLSKLFPLNILYIPVISYLCIEFNKYNTNMNSPTVILCTTNPYFGSRNRFFPSPDRCVYYRVHDDFPSYMQAKDAIFRLCCCFFNIPLYHRHYGLICSWLKRKGISYHYTPNSFVFEFDSCFYSLESYKNYLSHGYNPKFLCFD